MKFARALVLKQRHKVNLEMANYRSWNLKLKVQIKKKPCKVR